ncbi:DoxX family protein [Chloroflexia bacterium SDU3-3]|nr:DoxX family protein [Chloroflexia bacterium SDU3-3]
MFANVWARTQPYGLTVLRIFTGIVFFMHGWQKLTMMGIEGTAGFFGSLGIPLPAVAAVIVIALELLGGLALILGLGTRYIGLLSAFNMLVALLTVHLSKGFFAGDGGYEFVFLLMGASLALAFSGSGALALENLFGSRDLSASSASARQAA